MEHYGEKRSLIKQLERQHSDPTIEFLDVAKGMIDNMENLRQAEIEELNRKYENKFKRVEEVKTFPQSILIYPSIYLNVRMRVCACTIAVSAIELLAVEHCVLTYNNFRTSSWVLIRERGRHVGLKLTI
jgi:hypothetical protein